MNRGLPEEGEVNKMTPTAHQTQELFQKALYWSFHTNPRKTTCSFNRNNVIFCLMKNITTYVYERI